MRTIILSLILAASAWGAGCSGYDYSIPVTYEALGATSATDTTAGLNTLFPAVISFTSGLLRTTANGGASKSTGYDIAFSDLNNNTCSLLQIRSYNASTGAYTATVNVGLLAVGNVQGLLWVGKSSVSDPSTRNVWGSAYKFVAPLQEDASGGNPPFLDVSIAGNNSTASSTVTRVAATVGYAQTFAGGSSQKITFPNPIATGSTTTLSFSAVVKVASGHTAGYQNIWTNEVGSSNGCRLYALITTGNAAAYCTPEATNPVNSGVNISDDAWHHVMGILASTTVMRIYVDGVYKASQSGSFATTFAAGNSQYIGAEYGPVQFLYGLAQEMRVNSSALCTNTTASSLCPTAKAEFDMMTAPSSFARLETATYAY